MTDGLKFVVDGMLGKVARWLRIFGYDSKYFGGVDDFKLVNYAKRSGRILLTSDFELYKFALKSGVNVFYVDGNLTEADKLSKVVNGFKLKICYEVPSKTRCPVCNCLLKKVKPENVKGLIPENTLKTYKDFWVCRNKKCGKVYWKGKHWRQIRQIIQKVKEC
ncbi:MAG: Mut7-C RNAse domain-containing protein [Candidatus Bathyarchaeota archaeon]|nr:Mut7-C RNAse domain-containing protein [Candidatus Bathyarchaeota archaeon]